MMKKLVLWGVVLAVVVVLGGGLALNSAWVGERAFPYLLNRSFNESVVSRLRIGRQLFEIPDTFVLQDVECTLQKDKPYVVFFKRLHLDLQEAYFGSDKNIKLFGEGGGVTARGIDIRGITTTLIMPLQTKILRGPLSISQFQFDRYHISNMESQAVVSESTIELNRIVAEGYGGDFTGQLVVQRQPKTPFVAQADFSGVELNDLKDIHPEFFSQVSGIVSGRVIVVGEAARLRSLDVNVKTIQGGKVPASVLRRFIDYIPEQFQQHQIEAIASAGGDVLLETARVEIKSLTDEKLQAHIVLASRQLNVQVDLTMDINVEGGLKNIFGLLEKLSY